MPIKRAGEVEEVGFVWLEPYYQNLESYKNVEILPIEESPDVYGFPMFVRKTRSFSLIKQGRFSFDSEAVKIELACLLADLFRVIVEFSRTPVWGKVNYDIDYQEYFWGVFLETERVLWDYELIGKVYRISKKKKP